MNVFQYAALEEKMFESMARENGYTRKTTFYSDLSIAEFYSKSSVIDTYKNVVNNWKNNVEYFTEFVISLNWKSWEWHSKGYDTLGELYSELYYKAHDIALKTFKGEDLAYYIRVTD